MKEPNTAIARQLFDEGAVLIDTDRGFELKQHDMNPGAPRSPIKFNLRPPGTKGGKVSKDLFKKIGYEMALIAAHHATPAAVLIGVPNAGDVLVNRMREHSYLFERRRSFARVRLAKTEGAGVRRVSGIRDFQGYFPGDKDNVAWLIDDVVSQASSKVEALDLACAASFKVPVCLVVIDREQGGAQELKKYGVELVSLFTMSWLLEFYRDQGLIDSFQYEKIMNYKSNNQ